MVLLLKYINASAMCNQWFWKVNMFWVLHLMISFTVSERGKPMDGPTSLDWFQRAVSHTWDALVEDCENTLYISNLRKKKKENNQFLFFFNEGFKTNP